ncbi:type II toxin-antitoxin system RatA family toxin [Neorickettsia findlayensis]|uniref:Type II toxin-antitoxin system RatA family toxin n=1 Tax=Neorickettsia findlayensis TaxID=2686014 RepID=A0A6P1G9G7_9RICK|nr:type II toxin-antitoxin system RatA family toxin [Neorickettsia findlayensis]QHD65097.1 type II toxin-antitoxin system RatA family toxin [Neorickettsia findlayensis]
MSGQYSYRDCKILPFSAYHAFVVVLDVVRYPEFIPWCEQIRIISKEKDTIRAEVVISFKGMRSSYISVIKFLPPTCEGGGRIEVRSTEGVFKHLYTLWEFYPQGSSSKVSFYIEYALRSRLVNSMVRLMYSAAQKRIIEAFEQRCRTVANSYESSQSNK